MPLPARILDAATKHFTEHFGEAEHRVVRTATDRHRATGQPIYLVAAVSGVSPNKGASSLLSRQKAIVLSWVRACGGLCSPQTSPRCRARSLMPSGSELIRRPITSNWRVRHGPRDNHCYAATFRGRRPGRYLLPGRQHGQHGRDNQRSADRSERNFRSIERDARVAIRRWRIPRFRRSRRYVVGVSEPPSHHCRPDCHD